MGFLNNIRILILIFVVLVICVSCKKLEKKSSRERKAFEFNHNLQENKRSAGHSGVYESEQYIQEMARNQNAANQRALKGGKFFKKVVSNYAIGSHMEFLTSAQQSDIINMHNDLRNLEEGSDMSILTFNPKLASLAQEWAERCHAEHGQPPFSPDEVKGWKTIGQSFSANANEDWTPLTGVIDWYNEKKYYDYNNVECHDVCGHYTGLVWAATTDIGCGIAYCPSLDTLGPGHLLICNYGPEGNDPTKTPYVKGPACSQCSSGSFFCNNGLCDESCKSESSSCVCKADCKRGGRRTSDCKCECNRDSLGPNCADECKDLDPQCGENPGYPVEFCTWTGDVADTVRKSCPKLCGSCG